MYEFKCTRCGTIDERIVQMADVDSQVCDCGRESTMERVDTFQTLRPIFRGSGFYETDYGKE
jgi:putative FmdB family regulatory protein